MKSFIPYLFVGAVLMCPLSAQELTLKEEGGKISVRRGEIDLLVYHTAEMSPPEGVEECYRRSGFIHPLNTPKGAALTGIHPTDHYHHMGMWHAWVQTQHGSDTPDFWNLGKKTGRVRYTKTLEKKETPEWVSFTVQQEQVAYKGEEKTETVVLLEELKISAYVHATYNVIDYDLVQKNVSGEVLQLPAYRYGGPLVIRGRPSWKTENSEFLTSEGKTRKDSHATRANWCAVFGPTERGDATLVTFCHPKNHDAPQRLRTWPKGAIFLNWAAAQENGLEIKSGDSMTWRYRVVTADETLNKETMEALWLTYRAQ